MISGEFQQNLDNQVKTSLRTYLYSYQRSGHSSQISIEFFFSVGFQSEFFLNNFIFKERNGITLLPAMDKVIPVS